MTAPDSKSPALPFSFVAYRLPLFAFILLLILIGVARYAIFEQYKNSITEKEVQNLGVIADTKVAQIVAWRESQKRRAEYYMHGVMLPVEVEKWLREGAPENERKQKILNILGSIKKERDYKNIVLLDREGMVRISTNSRFSLDAEEKKLVMESMQNSRVLFLDLHREPEDNEITIDSVGPLMVVDELKGNRIVGALMFQIDPAFFLYPMLQSWPVQNSSAETLLIRREGNDILFLNDLRYQADTALSLSIPLSNTQVTGVRAVLGQTETLDGIDYRGVPVVAALRSVPDTPWFMVAKVDEAELFAPVYMLKIWTAGLGFLFAILTSGLFYFWYRGAKARYQQLQTQHDAAIERGALLKHFEYLTRYANDMIIVANKDGQLVEVNEKAQQALGYSREELLQMHVIELYCPDHSPHVTGTLKSLKRGEELRVEEIFQRKDGTTFPVEISARMIEMEGVLYLQGIIRDITERKLVETEIAKSQAMLKMVLDTIPSRVFWKDTESRYLGCSRLFARDAGLQDPSQIVGKMDRDLCWAEQAHLYIANDREVMRTMQPKMGFEMPKTGADGRLMYLEANKIPLTDAKGSLIGVLGSYHEITERKRAIAELISARDDAEQANKAKSNFLSHMSHELRTPLNSMIGFAEMMEASAADETLGAHHENIKTIIRSGWHLLRIFDDLLNLSAIEEKKIELNIDDVDLKSCLHECFDLMTPLASQKMIEFDYSDTECKDVLVKADAFRLKQVVINLLGNAIKFNKVGGNVTVRVLRNAGRIRIEISDTGTGIAEADLPGLFQPFSQHSKRPYSVTGAGIGLSIAKQLIELMGGKIGVESICYMGSKFWIELPASVGDRTLRMRAYIENVSRPENQAVMLYIEDTPEYAELVKQIFSGVENLNVVVAHTPTLGLDIAWAQKPDIILLDICLPGMNGYEVLSLLQHNKLTRDIPVMAISADATSADIETGLRAGFKYYFAKPLNVKKFKNIVLDMLSDKLQA